MCFVLDRSAGRPTRGDMCASRPKGGILLIAIVEGNSEVLTERPGPAHSVVYHRITAIIGGFFYPFGASQLEHNLLGIRRSCQTLSAKPTSQCIERENLSVSSGSPCRPSIPCQTYTQVTLAPLIPLRKTCIDHARNSVQQPYTHGILLCERLNTPPECGLRILSWTRRTHARSPCIEIIFGTNTFSVLH